MNTLIFVTASERIIKLMPAPGWRLAILNEAFCVSTAETLLLLEVAVDEEDVDDDEVMIPEPVQEATTHQ